MTTVSKQSLPSNRVGWVLYGTFLLSGAAGLMYQVAWTRYLSLLLGSTGIAQIIVLSTFMGGLGLGAWLFGKRADRSPSCLRLFVLLEFAIALYAVFFPLLFDALRGGYLGVARGLEPGSSPLLALKSVTAVIAILLPTVLMGGTLPVLSKYVTERLDLVGRQVARLYYLNSFGAVAGCLLAGFWFVGTYGLAVTMAIGASLDLIVAVVLGWRGLRQPTEATAVAPTNTSKTDTVSSNNEATDTNATNIEPTEGVAPEIYPEHLGRLALVVIGLSGVVSFIYEIVWIRMLALILGSSTYSFSLMVAAFIFGITLGSFLISFKRTDRGYYPLLGWLELAIGLTLLLSLPLYMWLPYTLNQLQGLLQRTPEAFPLYQLIKFSLCFAVMVPPTVFIGMTLPAASKIATRGLGTLGSQVGSVFAINTAGTLIGAVLGGAILMPWLGLRDTLLVGIVTNLALGFLILATAPGGLLGRREKSQETTAPNQPSAVPTDNVETSNVPIKSVDYSEIENIRTPEGVAVSESSVPGITDARDEYIGIQTPTGFPVSDSGEDYVSIQTPTGVPLSETSQLDVSHLDADGFAPGQNPIHGSGNFYIEPRRPLLLLGTLALLFTGTLAFVQTWDDRILMRSVFRMRETFESYEDYKAFTHRGEILAYKDGIDASIAVVKAGENYHSLYINGKPDATVHGTRETGFYSDMPTQLLIGHLGKLIHPDARDVLVVGQGSGVSAGAIAAYPDTNVELIELSREIVKFAKYFDWGNRNLHERENVTLINEDARTYLILSDKKYDLIVNQPSNPWVAGNASLFSLEFFEESKKHLTDDGLFLQWVQHYETTNDAMLLILRTFEEVFPYYTVWEMSRSDLALVGSSKPFTFDVETLVRGMQQPHVQEDLRAIGMSIPEILLSSLMIDSSHAPAHFGGFGSLNSEFHPILEYTAPLGFFLNKLPTYTEKLDLRRGAFQVTPLPWQTYQRGEDVPVTPSEIWQQAYLRSIPRSSVFKQQPQYILDRWEAADPENPWIEIYRADDVAEEGAREQLAIIDAALESDESLLEDPEFRTRLMVALNDAFANTKQNPARGRPYLERILQVLEYELATDPDDAWQLHRGRGLTYAWMQDYDKAVAELETALELGQAGYGAVGFWREDEVELYEFLALATVSAQQFDKTDRYLDLMGRETPAAAAVLGRLQLAQSRKK